MMSMSLYRTTRKANTSSPSSVNESGPGQCHLAGSSQEKVTRALLDQSNLPNNELLTSKSCHLEEEEGDFYFPMDGCSEDRNECSGAASKQKLRKQEVTGQQHHHQIVLSQLEAFFMGESSSTEERASPTSVMDTKSMDVSLSPKRNMFGQIIDDPIALKSLAEGEFRDGDGMQDSSYDLRIRGDEEASSLSSKETYPPFVKLSENDRAHSLPLNCVMNTKSLVKKPSLKKISSIGQGLTKSIRSENSLQRAVSFSSLSIREYGPAISDNPSCSFGPPIQLDWDYEAEETHSIDGYEEARPPRRMPHDLILSYYDRRFLLIKQAGYSRSEVKQAMKEAERVKRERMVTDIFLPVHAFDETMEIVMDAIKNFFRRDQMP